MFVLTLILATAFFIICGAYLSAVRDMERYYMRKDLEQDSANKGPDDSFYFAHLYKKKENE